jgi:two-component system, chemotaxis family, chemotaxis protein CheY
VLALVIDDSSTMRRIVRASVAQLGFSVYEALDGQDALSLLSQIPTVPDISLIDWNMPVMNGLDFVRQVHQMPEFRSMWLMMVTTEAEQSQIVRALAAGAHEYLIKPFTDIALHEKLAYLGLVPYPQS